MKHNEYIWWLVLCPAAGYEGAKFWPLINEWEDGCGKSKRCQKCEFYYKISEVRQSGFICTNPDHPLNCYDVDGLEALIVLEDL